MQVNQDAWVQPAVFEYGILLILKGARKKVSFKSPCCDIGILSVPFYYKYKVHEL